MKKEEIQILKKFLPINTAFGISNKEINILSTDKTMCLYYDPSGMTEFKKVAKIYSVDRFLTLLDTLGDDSDISLTDDYVIIKNGNKSIKYVLSGSGVVPEAPRDLENKFADWEKEITFTLNKNDLNEIKKISSILSLDELKLVGKDGKLEVLVTEQDNSSSSNFGITLDYEGEEACEVSFSTANISKLIDGDYSVEVSTNGFSKFSSKDIDSLRYLIANLA